MRALVGLGIVVASIVIGCSDDADENDDGGSNERPTGPLGGTIDGHTFVPAGARAWQRSGEPPVYVEIMSVNPECSIILPTLSEQPLLTTTMRFSPESQQPGVYELGQSFTIDPAPGTVSVSAGVYGLMGGMPTQHIIGLGPGDGLVYVDAWGDATIVGAIDIFSEKLAVTLEGTFEATFCPGPPGP
jgi:hypothetical protein